MIRTPELMSELLFEMDSNGPAIPIRFVRTRAARRYILRLQPNGVARVTIPWGGSRAFAMQFVKKHTGWLREQIQSGRGRHSEWLHGHPILFRGEEVRIQLRESGGRSEAVIGDQVAPLESGQSIRSAVEGHLRSLAEKELPDRTREIAENFGISFRTVTVRSQHSRWGSCSSRRAISLNWRLVQVPIFVRDYIIVHELMHLREMNHSDRFWQLVHRAYPEWESAERWLRSHGNLLR